MKTRIFLLTVFCFCVLTMVSCKNQKSQASRQVPEIVDSTKLVLADEVVALLDSMNFKFVSEFSDTSILINLNLSDKEKMIQPDFLFNPKEANAFVTKAQKERALAMLFVDLIVRENYQMPVEHSVKVIKEFMYDLDIPFEPDTFSDSTITLKDRILNLYSVFEEKNEISHFWRLIFSAQVEIMYIVSTRPELYLRDITQDDFAVAMERIQTIADAMVILYEYDPETREIVDSVYDGDTYFKFTAFKTVDEYKLFLVSKREILEKRRAELMKKFPLAGSGLAM